MITRYSNVKFDKWEELHQAIGTLINREEDNYKKHADIHADRTENPYIPHLTHRMHGRGDSKSVGARRFLPWHRAYLIIFERKIREINQELSIPYWDWHADGGQLIGFKGFTGLSSGRQLGALPGVENGPGRGWFVTTSTYNELTRHAGGYDSFSEELEEVHNLGHLWIGGDMATWTSPNDPAFWFHHAQIDRIWAEWQKKNPEKIANLSGTDAELDPWDDEFDVQNINNISNLGSDSYQYE